MLDSLRACLDDETNCLYFLHTPFGEIKVDQIVYRFPGFVAIQGEDTARKLRFFVFSEETICSFPLEVRRRNDSKGTLGFHLSADTPIGAQSKAL
jgi:hypothetical protein